MQNPLAQTEVALNSTLLHKATGQAFDDLCQFLGIPRIRNWPIRLWRQAALFVAFNSRGSMATTYRFLLEALKDYRTPYQVTVLGSLSQRYRITWVSGGTSGGFVPGDLQKLWLIDGQIYWSVTGDGTWSGGVSPYLILSRFSSSYWSACDWRAAGYHPSTPTGLTAEKQPFFFDEYNNLVNVHIDFSAAYTDTPPTYLQTFYSWGLPAFEWSGTSFVFPDNARAAEESGTLERLTVTADYGDTVNRGGSYTFTLYKNGSPTSLVAVLGATDTQAVDAVNTVTYVKGDVLNWRCTSAISATGLYHAIVTVFRQPPVGQPPGGYVLADSSQDDPNVGPWPLYLPGDAALLWQAFLSRLLALGTAVRVTSGKFGVF